MWTLEACAGGRRYRFTSSVVRGTVGPWFRPIWFGSLGVILSDVGSGRCVSRSDGRGFFDTVSSAAASRKGTPGRPAGIPNRDKAELRALLQEKVHEFTELRMRQDEADGVPPEQRQQIVEDYDPVVALALVAVDRRSTIENRIRCNAEVAQYVRPKLKSVEVTADPEALETLEQRRELSERLVGLLEMAAKAKKEKAPRKNAPPPPAEGDEA